MLEKKNKKEGVNDFFRNAILLPEVTAGKNDDVQLAIGRESEPSIVELIVDDRELQIESTDKKRYREIECSRCYQLLSKNKMATHEIQKISGESSGSNWSSQLSSSTGYNGRLNNFRVNASKRVGKSSGKTFYKNSTIWLCPDCNLQFLEEEKQKFFNKLLVVAFVILAVISVIFLKVVVLK